MGGQIEELLSDVSRQMGGVERLLEAQAAQSKQDREDIVRLREKVATLEEAGRWDGADRRKVEKRLGTGDHTFQKLQTEVALMQAMDVQRDKEIEGLRKSIAYQGRQLASRRWARVFWSAAIPAIVSIVAAIIMKAVGG
jgi:hypothetical protein